MMEFKHTPGPWKVSETGVVTTTKANIGPVIATVNSMSYPGSSLNIEQNANMELIAAAPELLEALYNLVTHDDTKSFHIALDLIMKLTDKNVLVK